MWIDARQHIASLVAVFLALGIGMLIGGTVPGAGGLREQEQALIRNLERSLDRFEARNEELQGNLSALRGRWEAANRLNDALLRLAFEDRLAGRSVNFLGVGTDGLEPINWQTDGLLELHRLLERSGAQIFSVTPASDARPTTEAGSEEAPEFARVVIVRRSGGSGAWEQAWEQLANLHAEASALIVAQSSTLTALPPHLTPRDGQEILVVDHVDTAAGTLTLLEGLRSDVVGHYGLLDGAIGQYPEVRWGGTGE